MVTSLAPGINLAFDIYPADDPKDGTRLVRLTKDDFMDGTSYRTVLRGTGSGNIVLPANHAAVTSGFMVPDNYVRVVDLDVTEIVGGFFLDEGSQTVVSRDEQGGEILSFGGPGTLAYLARATMPYPLLSPADASLAEHNAAVASNGYLRFTGPETYGGILGRVIVEGQLDTPSGIPALGAHDWDDADDSGGTAWAVFDDYYDVDDGANILDVSVDLMRKGIDLFIHPDTFVPSAYTAGTYGTNRTSATFTAGKVRFERGVNIAADLEKAIHRIPYVSHMRVIGDVTYSSVTVIDPDWSSGDTAVHGTMHLDTTHDGAILADAGFEAIRLRKLVSDEASFPHLPGDDAAAGKYRPGMPGGSGDYWVGDTVTLHTGTGVNQYDEQAIQVAAITWRIRNTGTFDPVVELGAQYLSPLAQAGQLAGNSTIGDSGCCMHFCVAQTGGDEVVTGYESLDWDSGEEQWAHPYGGDTTDVGTRSTYFSGGAAGTTHGGNIGGFGGGGATGQKLIVTPGDVLRISAYSEGFGQSWPCTDFGTINFSWGVQFFTSGDVLISTHTVGAHQTAQDSGYVGPDTADVTVPATAAYLRLATQTDAMPCEQGGTHVDQLTIGTLTTSNPTFGTDSWTGEEDCAARGDHTHYAVGTIGDRPDPTTVPVNAQYFSTDTNTIYYSNGTTWVTILSAPTTPDASQISYDNAASGLTADDVQEAIDELAGTIGTGDFVTTTGGGGEGVQNHGNLGSTETIDLANGNVHTGTLDADTTLTFTGFSANPGISFALFLTQDGTGGWDVTFPASVLNRTALSAALDQTASTLQIIGFVSADGGTSIYGFIAGGSGGGASALDDLTDVTITSPAENEQLQYISGAWVNNARRWEPVTFDPGTGPEIVFTSTDIVMTWESY